MTQAPPADVLGGGVAEDAVRQNDSHASARPEPVETALDEQDLGSDAAPQPPGVAKASVLRPLPDVGEVEGSEDVFVGDRDGGSE